MKKLFSSIYKSALALCLTFHPGLAMDWDEQMDVEWNERTFKVVMDCRKCSSLSYNRGTKAENLWEKRKHYLKALKDLDRIYEEYPKWWDQTDIDNYTLIIKTLELCAYNQWMRGQMLFHELRKDSVPLL